MLNTDSLKTICTIKFNTFEEVRDFVNKASNVPYDLLVCSTMRKYIVDAKSIIGIFSLDLENPINLKVSDNLDESEYLEFKKDIQHLIVY